MMINAKGRRTRFNIIGVIAIIIGVVIFVLPIGRESGLYTYGGDAYTGIQQAAA